LNFRSAIYENRDNNWIAINITKRFDRTEHIKTSKYWKNSIRFDQNILVEFDSVRFDSVRFGSIFQKSSRVSLYLKTSRKIMKKIYMSRNWKLVKKIKKTLMFLFLSYNLASYYCLNLLIDWVCFNSFADCRVDSYKKFYRCWKLNYLTNWLGSTYLIIC